MATTATSDRSNLIINSLYDQLKSGENVDVVFLAGEEGVRLPAHLNIVTAASEILATGLSPRWEGRREIAVDNVAEIQLPVNLPGLSISVDAAKAFIMLMYGKPFNEVEQGPTLDTTLELLTLCDMYFNDELLDIICDEVATKIITTDTCIPILDRCRNLPRCRILLQRGFNCFRRDLKQFLNDTSSTWWEELWNCVLRMEGPAISCIPEISLFQKLLCWRNDDSTREGAFRRLIKFIRFPIMSAEIIAGKIRQSGVLTEQELGRLLCYVVGGGSDGDILSLEFNRNNRSRKIAATTQELKTLLQTAGAGDVINVAEGEYEGPFKLTVSRVTIIGKGDKTKIISNLTDVPAESPKTGMLIKGNDVKVSSLHFVSRDCDRSSKGLKYRGIISGGSRNSFENISFSNCGLVLASGNYNLCNSLTFSDGYAGIYVTPELGPIGKSQSANGNRFSNITFTNLKIGLALCSRANKNVVDNISCVNVVMGLWVLSDENTIKNVSYEILKKFLLRGQVVTVDGGSRNILENIVFMNNDMENKEEQYLDGAQAKKRKFDKEPDINTYYYIIKDRSSTESGPTVSCNNRFVNCGAGPFKINGENHSFINVDAGELVCLSGNGHSFIGCRADEVIKSGDVLGVEVSDCNFTVE